MITPRKKAALAPQKHAQIPHLRNSWVGLRVAITGGTSGLGLALVRELLARGSRVALVARGRNRVEQVARESDRAHGIVGDISVQDEIHPIALQITAELGGL